MRRPPTIDLMAAALAIAVPATLLACSTPIWTRGEAREGLVVRDIVRNGHWVVGWRDGVLASKPPLFHWIAAAMTPVLGLGDTVVRLPSMLAAVVLVLVTMTLGFAMGGRRRAWLATGILGSCFLVWQAAAEARVDMVLAATVTVSLAGFWRWYSDGTSAGRAACYLGAAAAVLAKGPAGAVLPAAVIVVFLVLERDLAAVRRLWSWPLVLTAVVLVGGWYALAYRAAGQAFLEKQLIAENLHRLSGEAEFSKRHDPLKLVTGFVENIFPWSVLAIVGLVRPGRFASTERRFLHAWWIAVLMVFSLAAGKRNVYLLPLYPAVALLSAELLAGWTSHARTWAVAAALGVLDVAVLIAVGQGRVRAARHDHLLELAHTIRERVPASVVVRAGPGLLENDVIVSAYVADRTILRARLQCEPNTAWIVPAAHGVTPPAGLGSGTTVLARAPGAVGATLLVRCPDAAAAGPVVP